MSSLIFKCCKHGTDPTDCPICQRILLVWFLKQIRPDLLKVMVRHVASFLPKDRLFIRLCSTCLVTRRTKEWSLQNWKSKDIDGVFCMDSKSREVYISCSSNSKYFHGASNRSLYLLKDGQRITYEQFCAYYSGQRIQDLCEYKFFLWGCFWKLGYEMISMYKEAPQYIPDICDRCIDKLIENNEIEDVDDFGGLSEEVLEHDGYPF